MRRTVWRPGLHRVQQAATVEGEGKRMQRPLHRTTPPTPGTAPRARPERTALRSSIKGWWRPPSRQYVRGVSGVPPVMGGSRLSPRRQSARGLAAIREPPLNHEPPRGGEGLKHTHCALELDFWLGGTSHQRVTSCLTTCVELVGEDSSRHYQW